jgi:hypothetical protein
MVNGSHTVLVQTLLTTWLWYSRGLKVCVRRREYVKEISSM